MIKVERIRQDKSRDSSFPRRRAEYVECTSFKIKSENVITFRRPLYTCLFNLTYPPWLLQLLTTFALPLTMRMLNALVLLRHCARILRILEQQKLL